MSNLKTAEFPFVQAYTDRHGTDRFYFRRSGWPRSKLPGRPGSADFAEAYQAAIANPAPRPAPSEPVKVSRAPALAVFAIKRAFETARSRAPRRGLEFTLTREDVAGLFSKQDGRCALSGCEFRAGPRGVHHKSPFAPSIDRIDNSKGYVLENVRLVCVAVNFALGEWGETVLEEVARGFLAREKRSTPLGVALCS